MIYTIALEKIDFFWPNFSSAFLAKLYFRLFGQTLLRPFGQTLLGRFLGKNFDFYRSITINNKSKIWSPNLKKVDVQCSELIEKYRKDRR